MLTNLLSRRRMLSTAAHGFGAAALACLLQEELVAADPPNQEHHLRPKSGHHAARAKRALFLWMSGGPSQVDTFDPKPKLLELHGQDIPIQLPPHLRDAGKRIVASPFKFSQHGEAGLPISEIFPQLAQHADDLCVVRSMKCDNIDHVSATMQLFSGEQMSSRPSLGAWLMYGLGTENHNLPGFFVISPGKDAFVHPAMIGTSFLPAIHEGTPIRDLDRPLANIKHPELSLADQRLNLDVLRELNQLHQEHRPEDSRLEARIASFETAFRMQVAAPDALDVSQESQAAHRLYGLDDKLTNQFGTECLMARRLLERGVRFVHVNHYSKAQGQDRWDQHGDLEKGHRANAAEVDRPITGLLTDLKSRGMLKDTLVIWGGEFGRSPTGQGSNGREHHPHGFSIWLAGGGVKGGLAFGSTDDFGWYAERDVVHIHDLHATILHLMGLDHERLTWRHAGRDYRLTDVHGRVVKEIVT